VIVIDENHLTDVGDPGRAVRRRVRHVTCADPRLPGTMSFKGPRPGDRQVLGRVHTALGWRDQLPEQERDELDSVTTWPLAMVTHDGRGMGWLTRVIARDYWVEARKPGRGPAPSLFDLDRLCGSTQPLSTGSTVHDDLVRLALMARLAYAIEIIHRPYGGRRLVYGDLNLHAAAVAVGPPRLLLLQCEGVADVDDVSRVQANDPHFVPPERGLQDQLTDDYKLGLCVIRCLSAGRGAATVTDAASRLVRPGLLDRAGVDLLNLAVGPDRERRPTAEQIKDWLIGRVLQLTGLEVRSP
jgi:hypothetical protein